MIFSTFIYCNKKYRNLEKNNYKLYNYLFVTSYSYLVITSLYLLILLAIDKSKFGWKTFNLQITGKSYEESTACLSEQYIPSNIPHLIKCGYYKYSRYIVKILLNSLEFKIKYNDFEYTAMITYTCFTKCIDFFDKKYTEKFY